MMSAPLALTSSGRIALTVAAVPTGMNAGVRISPRFMAILPVRADPSVSEISKRKRVIADALAPPNLQANASALRHSQGFANLVREPNPHAAQATTRSIG